MDNSLRDALLHIDAKKDVVGLVTAASMFGLCTSWGTPVSVITTDQASIEGAVEFVRVPNRTRTLVVLDGYTLTSEEDTIADLIITDYSPQFLCEALYEWYNTERGGSDESWGTLDEFMMVLGINKQYEYWKEIALLD